MLDKNAIAAASKTLHDHWRAGTKFSGLDESLRPRDRIEAYAIQAGIEKYSCENLFGWKIAATSEAGQKHIIADKACAHLFVLGSATSAHWRSLDLVEERPVVGLRAQQFIGHGKNVLGDPRVALTWLANELRQLGVTLKAGRIVTTGTCHPPLPIQSGDFCAVDFGSLGKVSVGFA